MQNAILITKDIEFGNHIMHPRGAHHGLIVLRLPYKFITKDIARILKIFLTNIDSAKLAGKISIIEVGRYRIREL